MKKTTISITAVFFLLLAVTTSTFAQTANGSASGQFSLQGMLTTNSGTPIADGVHTIVANVYSTANGSVVYTETATVNTIKGLFSTMIGANGTGGAKLNVKAGADYQLGISVDGGTELAPKISLASALSALTSKLAANADSVGGFAVATANGAKANTLVVLNGAGKIDSSLLSGSIVSSVNGVTGPINIQGGGNLGVTTSGNTVNLSFTGSGTGGLNLPFSQTLNLPTGSTGFSITNSLAGTAASFANTGLGSALNATATTGSAISASTTGSATGAATLDLANTGGTALNAVSTSASGAVMTLKNLSANASAQLLSAANSAGTQVLGVAANGQTTITSSVSNALNVSTSAGTAINATATASSDAVLKVQNMSASAGANLVSALNSAGTPVLTVAGNGQTTITSTAGNALNVTTSAAGEAALAINGGLKITGGAVGTGTINSGSLTATINNALVKANSIILVTVSGAGATAVPVQVSAQGSGSFVVSAITNLTGVAGNVNFNYLIINQ